MDRGDYHRRQYEFLLPPATALAPVQQRQHQVCVPMMMDEQFSAGRGGPETRGQRKQRFTDEQIRSLESMFHAHHAKLDPREKADLARDLGLQPRQVAIWFQNKRARWRSKQLEHDYAALRAKFDALHSCVEALKQEKVALTSQLHELSERLTERGGAATTASSSSCNDDDMRNAVGCVDIKPPESCVLGGTACATPADVSVDSECAYDGGFPESFCATPELWEPWPLIEWNAVA